MKIKNTSKEGFTPVEIKITIESLEERKAIEEMTLANVSIPKLVQDSRSDIVRVFLNSLRAEIQSSYEA